MLHREGVTFVGGEQRQNLCPPDMEARLTTARNNTSPDEDLWNKVLLTDECREPERETCLV